ncbi:MAG TPA: FliH/SctL family protein, partial [Tepidisphaeraceae bacterium]
MPLIKSAHAPANAMPFSMSDIEAHARALLLRANQQAEQLLAAAQAEGELMRKQAHAEGRAAGLAEGKREGVAQGRAEGMTAGKQQAFEAEQEKLGSAFALVVQLAETFDAERHRVLQQAEADVLPLAFAVARKITRRLGEIDPGVFEANLRDALRLVSTSHDLRITLHPDQRELLDDLMPRLQQQWPQLKHVALVSDETIAPGGCRVNTAGGEINA